MFHANVCSEFTGRFDQSSAALAVEISPPSRGIEIVYTGGHEKR